MYQALYRQYRPKTFTEVLGQEHITTTLKNQIQKGNIGHAYLFSGTRGTGKTSAAKIFSRAVNCLNPIDGDPCNQCESCKGILEESIMDVIEMDAASNNSVEDIRELREKIIYPPANIKYKVYIIDEVHMLSKGAFNALLKTLEEPPKHLIFLLATTEPERLPQTILSRCQRFDFKRITNQDLFTNMQTILKDFKVEVEDEVLNLIARNSDGAMRDALSLLDQLLSFSEEKIGYKEAIDILGIANKDLIFQMIYDMKDRKIENVIFSIDEIIQNGKDIHQFIKDIILHFRNLMIVKSSNNPKSIEDLDDIDEFITQSNSIDMDYILKALDTLTQAESQAKWSTNPRIMLEMAAIKLVNLNEELSLIQRIERLESGISISGNTEVAKPYKQNKQNIHIKNDTDLENKGIIHKDTEDVETADNKTTDVPKNIPSKEEPQEIIDDGKELSLDTLVSQWQNILQKVKATKVSLYALVIEGEVLSFENNILTIGYKESFGFHQQAVSKRENKELIEKILSTHFNKNISVNFTMGSKKIEKKAERPDTKKDDAIKGAMDFFNEIQVDVK